VRRVSSCVIASVLIVVLSPGCAQAAAQAAEAPVRVSLEEVLRPFAVGGLAALLVLAAVGALTASSGSDDLGDVPTAWSLPDSWVTTVTGASSALLAVLGATDSLDALLGETPEEAAAKLVLVTAFSALVVALAPLVAAVVGGAKGATRAGLLLSAGVTVAGSLGLVAGVWTVFAEAQEDALSVWSPAGVVPLVVGALISAYAVVTLTSIVRGSAQSVRSSVVAGQVVSTKRSLIL
jgi:hypothetical protein